MAGRDLVAGVSLLHTFETGLRSLFGHRLRSILTTLGILFGVAAVISTVGIGTASAERSTRGSQRSAPTC